MISLLLPIKSTEDKDFEFVNNIEFCKNTLVQMCNYFYITNGERGSYFSNLHMSPLKIHFYLNSRFTVLEGGAQFATSSIRDAIKYLQVVPGTQDAVLKLSYFERKGAFYTNDALVKEILQHYSSQGVKQALSFVAGLEVLGNPAGVVRSLARGVEDLFYEPYQGAVQGPLEFLEGITSGVGSLVGHTVGGAAGAVSTFAGSIGRGLSALTLDPEYQRYRRISEFYFLLIIILLRDIPLSVTMSIISIISIDL